MFLEPKKIIGEDNTNDSPLTRIISAISRNDLAFLKRQDLNSIVNLGCCEDLVTASLYQNDTTITKFLIESLSHKMNMNNVINEVVAHSKLDLAKDLYNRCMGIWTNEGVCRAAFAGDLETVKWCMSIKKPDVYDEMSLSNAMFKGGIIR